MGRIPKLEKERALYEAHCTTTSATSTFGSAPGDVRPTDQEHDAEWRDLSGSPDVSVSSGDLPMTVPTPGTTTTGQLSDQLPSTRSSSYQSVHQLSNLPEHLAIKDHGFRNDECERNVTISGLQTSPNCNLQSMANPGAENFGRSDMVERVTNANFKTNHLSQFVTVINPTSVSSSLTHLSTHSRPLPLPQSSYEGRPWKDFHLSSTDYHQSPGLDQPPPVFDTQSSFSYGAQSSKGPSLKKSKYTQNEWNRDLSDFPNSYSHEIKRETLEFSDASAEQQQRFRLQNKTYPPNCNQINDMKSQASLRPGVSITTYNSPSQNFKVSTHTTHQPNSLKENVGRRSDEIFEDKTVHCDNPFSHMESVNATAGISRTNMSFRPGIRSTALENEMCSTSGQLLHGPATAAKNTSDWGHSHQNISNDLELSSKYLQSQYEASTLINQATLTHTSDSGFSDEGDVKPFDTTTSVNSKECSRRSAYSPDLVKVLLNRVGGERLKGLKQHIMTGIAPVCGPEEFQAAAELLRMYSGDSKAEPVNSDTPSCASRQLSVKKEPSQTQLELNEIAKLGETETSFLNIETPGNKDLDVFDKQQTKLFFTSTPASTTQIAQKGRFVHTSEDTNPLNHDFFSHSASKPISSEVRVSNISAAHFQASEEVKSLSLPGANQHPNSNHPDATFIGPMPTVSWRTNSAFQEPGCDELSYPGDKTLLSGLEQNCLSETESTGPLLGHSVKDFLPGRASESKNEVGLVKHNSLDAKSHPNSCEALQGGAVGKSDEDIHLTDLGPTLSRAFDTHMALFKLRYAEMAEVVKNERPMKVHPMVPGAKEIVYQQLIGSIEAINKAIIGFCNCVPGLSSVPKADKDYLTKRAYYDIWMLTNSRLFHEGQSYLRLPDGTYYNREWMEVILNTKIVQVFFNFSEAFNSLNLSQLEVAILCAIQLTTPGNVVVVVVVVVVAAVVVAAAAVFSSISSSTCSLFFYRLCGLAVRHSLRDRGESSGVCPISCKEKVEHINSKLVDLLVLEVGRRHKHNGPRVLVDIFRLLPNLAEINTLQQEIIANFTADTVPENVSYSPKSPLLADLSEEQLNAVFNE
ncbi:ecdysone-induced protein 78C [Elysia marginata]|uniref:Ecdysone-induced protein 78C n=1 Tax=Elysia marginata TaxID=1093978 RepID=A0AAV4EMJ3_9GAST|nr:ecdysone-induced protein 78C [Elysia marginata]